MHKIKIIFGAKFVQGIKLLIFFALFWSRIGLDKTNLGLIRSETGRVSKEVENESFTRNVFNAICGFYPCVARIGSNR